MEVYVGVDWGHERSRAVASDSEGNVLLDQWVATEMGALKDLASELGRLAAGGRVQVMLEAKAGPVVSAMLGASIEVIAVNPKKVDRARELFAVAGPKDDLRDASTLLWMLRHCPEVGVVLSTGNPLLNSIRTLGRRHLDVTEKRVAVRNQLADLCRTHFPKLLSTYKSFDCMWHAHLVVKAPTPSKLRKLGPSRLAKFLKKHRVRAFTAEALLASLGDRSTDLNQPGVELETTAWELQMLGSQLVLLNEQRAQLQKKLDDLFERYHEKLVEAQGEVTDVVILDSVPGVGRCVTASLLGEGLLPMLVNEFQMARCYSGVAPVSKMTGKRQRAGKQFVSMRRACNIHLRRAVHFMADNGRQKNPALRLRYADHRAKGHTHGRTCRQMADRQLAVIRAMLRDRKLYSEEGVKSLK